MSRVEHTFISKNYGEATFAYGVDHGIGVFVTIIAPKISDWDPDGDDTLLNITNEGVVTCRKESMSDEQRCFIDTLITRFNRAKVQGNLYPNLSADDIMACAFIFDVLSDNLTSVEFRREVCKCLD